MADDTSPPTYEDLAAIEDDFDEIDVEIMRRQYELSQTAYAKRADAVSKIQNFWPLVIEQAPPDLDGYITPQDSAIFSHHLLNLSVTRPELENNLHNGNPRSVRIRFEFSENENFSDTVLEKTLWHRRAKDGWAGLVSEPVKIHWKKGKDLTEGLTDAAVALYEARKKVGDMMAKNLKEYTVLEQKVEHLNGASTSFFTWFGFVSGRRYVSAEESEEAYREHAARKQARKEGVEATKNGKGKETELVDEKDGEEGDDDQAVEVHEAGEEVAISIAEDLWPNAIKFFMQAQELEGLSDPEFEEDDEMEGEEEDDDDDDGPVDIQSLVQSPDKGRSRDSSGPPQKKVKK